MKKLLEVEDLSEESPETIVREILTQAKELVARLAEEANRNEIPLSAERYQDALISFSQVILLSLAKISQKIKKELENELFLSLARLTLEELLARKPSQKEFDYFLTYYRSHFELLRRELEEGEHPWKEPKPSLGERDLETLLKALSSRLLAQEGEISH